MRSRRLRPATALALILAMSSAAWAQWWKQPPPGGQVVAPGPPAPAGEPLRVTVWSDKAVYRIGDAVRFGLRVNRDAYVTLVNFGTSGNAAILYPNSVQPGHVVRSGRDVVVPSPESGFTLTIRGPAGRETVRAIATEEPVDIEARDWAATLETVRARIAPGKWAESSITIEVTP